ncbi:MAG: hypothetical protein AAF943_13020 [Pseudomonadota bacterium]
MRLKLLALLCATVPTLAAAQSFKAINRLDVIPLGSGNFEVIEAYGEGARGMWCAAADYAMAISPANGQRLYVQSARAPSLTRNGRKGAVFTTNRDNLSVAPSRSVTVSVEVVGQGLPLHHAIQFCRESDRDGFIIIPGQG